MAADNKDPSKFIKRTIAGFQAGFQVLVRNKTWLRVSLETLPSRLDLKVDESIRDENESSLMKYRLKIGLNLSRHEKSFFLGNKSHPWKKIIKKFLPNFFFSLHPFFCPVCVRRCDRLSDGVAVDRNVDVNVHDGDGFTDICENDENVSQQQKFETITLDDEILR